MAFANDLDDGIGRIRAISGNSEYLVILIISLQAATVAVPLQFDLRRDDLWADPSSRSHAIIAAQSRSPSCDICEKYRRRVGGQPVPLQTNIGAMTPY